MSPTPWTHYKPHLENQRLPTPNDWILRDSLKRPNINPVTWVAIAAVVVGVMAFIRWH